MRYHGDFQSRAWLALTRQPYDYGWVSTPMVRTTPHSTRDAQHKKPAEIHLINGETILAPDHDTTNSWCIVYKPTTTGIAKKIPREAILYIDREAEGTPISNKTSEVELDEERSEADRNWSAKDEGDSRTPGIDSSDEFFIPEPRQNLDVIEKGDDE